MNCRRICFVAVLVLILCGLVAADNENVPEDRVSPAAAKDRMRRVWREHVGAPSELSPSTITGFNNTLRVLRSLQITSDQREGEPETTTTAKPKPTAVRKPHREPTTQPVKLTEETLKRLKRYSRTRQVDPKLLADAFRLAGRNREAADFYLLAAQQATDSQDKGWFGFLSATCLRTNDQDAAMKQYDQLRKDYPDQVWSSIGGVQRKVIEWRALNNVDSLLDSVRGSTSE